MYSKFSCKNTDVEKSDRRISQEEQRDQKLEGKNNIPKTLFKETGDSLFRARSRSLEALRA